MCVLQKIIKEINYSLFALQIRLAEKRISVMLTQTRCGNTNPTQAKFVAFDFRVQF